jgi:hypothetical protein
MAPRMIVHTLRVAAVSGNWFENRRRGRSAQRRSEHQNQRRDDAECEKRKQNRQRKAQYICRIARDPPNNPGDSQAYSRGDHPASIADFQPCLAMRALHTVGERDDTRRGNGLSAVRAHSSRHYSPRKKQTRKANKDIAMGCQGKARNHFANANSTRRRIGSIRSARTRTRSPSFQVRRCPLRPHTMA